MTNIKGIADISGFGEDGKGGSDYEQACQDMLQAGFEWLKKNKKPDLKATTYKNIYGGSQPRKQGCKVVVRSSLQGSSRLHWSNAPGSHGASIFHQ